MISLHPFLSAGLRLAFAASVILVASVGCDSTEEYDDIDLTEGAEPALAAAAQPEAVPDAQHRSNGGPELKATCGTGELAANTFSAEVSESAAFGNYCPLGSLWEPDQAIEVVYHADLADQLCVNAENPCDISSLSTTIRTAIDEFHDSAGASIRLKWGGRCRRADGSDCGWNDTPPGKILLRADPAKKCLGTANASPIDTDGDGVSDTGRVTFCTIGDQRQWQSFSGEPGYSVHKVLLHELMHALGFHHPDECGLTPIDSALQGTNSPHLEQYDIDALLSAYQFRDKTRRIRHEDALYPHTWTTGSSGSGTGHLALSRITACDNSSSGGTHVAFTDTIGRWLRFNTFGSDGTWNGSASFISDPGATHSHPGIACDDFDNLQVFFTKPEGLGHQVNYMTSSTAGASWSGPFVADDTNIPNNQGVDATFDPVSGFYIYTIRNTSDEVGTRVMSPGSTTKFYNKEENSHEFCNNPGGGGGVGGTSTSADCWRTLDTASISCGDSSAGKYNCLLAWADTSWTHPTRYATARVVAHASGGHILELGDVRTHAYVTMGTPDVAWAVPGSAQPWRLALHQGGATWYTWAKGIRPTASWENQRGHSAGRAVVSPTLGTQFIPFWFISIPRVISLTTSSAF